MEKNKAFIIRGNNVIGMDVQKVYTSTPVGIIQPFASDTNIPRGYLLCDGASYPTAEYPDLYAVIGNTYGGDSTNFNVPDYRETVLVGVGENTTDTIASHDVYELGEFKDDQLQSHKHTLTIPDSYYQYTPTASHGPGAMSKYTAETSNNSGRSGTTTHGKQKGVTYIIKAFHTNEGVDSGVSDDVVEYVEGEIAEVDTELTAKIATQTANRQVKTFDNTGSSTDKWYKICSAITGGIGCNIKLTASRADSTATVQYFSALFRDSRYRYTSSYISREKTVYESGLVAEYSAYIVADANNDIWVHVPSYGKAIIEIDTRAITIDGTAGTPVKDYAYSSFRHQTIDESFERINIKQFNQPGSNTSFKYVTITSTGSGLGGLELNVPYAGKYMFSTPKSEPVYFGSSVHKGYTLNGWAWSDDGKTLYLRVGGFAPFSISVLGSVPKDTSVNNVVTISDMTSTAPEGVVFVTSPVYSNATTKDIVGTKTVYRGNQSIDISTGGKLTLIVSSEYSTSAGCYMLLSNYNVEPTLIKLGGHSKEYFNVTSTHKSNNVDTITVTTQGDDYTWFVLQF